MQTRARFAAAALVLVFSACAARRPQASATALASQTAPTPVDEAPLPDDLTALAREAVQSGSSLEMYQASLQLVSTLLVRQLIGTGDEVVTVELKRRLQSVFEDAAPYDLMVERLAPLVASSYQPEELRALIRFQRSPAERRVLQIVRELPASLQAGGELEPLLRERIRAAFARQGFAFDEGVPAIRQPLSAVHPPVEDRRLALARALIPDDVLRPIIEQFRDGAVESALQKQAKRINPNDPQKEIPRLKAAFTDAFSYEEIRDLIAWLYARHLSAEELDELVAFHRSPVGQKSLRLTPGLLREGRAAVESLFKERLESSLRKWFHQVPRRPAPSPEESARYQRQCESGVAEACNDLARSFLGTSGDRTKARKLFEEACTRGSGDACWSLGGMVESDPATPKSSRRVDELFERACSLGSGDGCTSHGFRLWRAHSDQSAANGAYEKACALGNGLGCSNRGYVYTLSSDPRDLAQANRLFEAGCNLGEGAACTNLGESYATARGVSVDRQRANALFEVACDDYDDGRGCNMLGIAYELGTGEQPDAKLARGLYQRGCRLGNGSACHNQGTLLADGRGGSADRTRANELYQKSCDLEVGVGCRKLGLAFDLAQGIERNQARADELYEKACNLDDGEACGDLGFNLASGFGAPVDPPRAERLFEKGCELGNARSCRLRADTVPVENRERVVAYLERACTLGPWNCNDFAIHFENGDGVPKDPRRAAALYERACVSGNGYGCSNAGFLHRKGEWVERDTLRADRLMRRACELGDAGGCGALSKASPPADAPPANAPRLPDSIEGERALLAQGLAEVEKGQLDAASVSLKAVLESPSFEALGSAERHSALSAAAFTAQQLDRLPQAAPALREACALEEATLFDCHLLLQAAWKADDSKDRITSLTAIARRWPEALSSISESVIVHVAGDNTDPPAPRLALLDALFDSGWKADGIEPAGVWKDLVFLHLGKGETERAAEVARRIDDAEAVISLYADKRFDKVRLASPDSFDAVAVWSRQLETRRAGVRASPRSVRTLLHLLDTLELGRRFDEMLSVTAAALARGKTPDAFADPERLVWVADERARALEALGRWDEALEERRGAAAMQENGLPNVSQALNLAVLYLELDRPAEALAALEKTGDASDYGRMVAQSVNLRAALETGDRAAAKRALDYMRDHRKAAPILLLRALCWQGESEEASVEARAQLASPELRSELLDRLQEYPGAMSTRRRQEWSERWRALFQRPEVKAAVDEVGRIGTWRLGR